MMVLRRLRGWGLCCAALGHWRKWDCPEIPRFVVSRPRAVDVICCIVAIISIKAHGAGWTEFASRWNCIVSRD